MAKRKQRSSRERAESQQWRHYFDFLYVPFKGNDYEWAKCPPVAICDFLNKRQSLWFYIEFKKNFKKDVETLFKPRTKDPNSYDLFRFDPQVLEKIREAKLHLTASYYPAVKPKESDSEPYLDEVFNSLDEGLPEHSVSQPPLSPFYEALGGCLDREIYIHRCAECRRYFPTTAQRDKFCCDAHRVAFNKKHGKLTLPDGSGKKGNHSEYQKTYSVYRRA